MRPHATFRTNRLVLRRITMTDAEAIFTTYAQNRDVTRYVVWQPHQDISETREFLQRCAVGWETGREFTWAICLPGGPLIGSMALQFDDFKAQTGYVLAQPYWGNGYASEALQAIVDWTMQQEAVYRLWAVCDCENLASARVMEKAGMTREGILRRWIVLPQVSSRPRDCLCYSIVKSNLPSPG